MDTITQAVLGAAVAEVGWRGELGKKAIYTGVFCGLLPDFDIVAALGGQWGEILFHRGPTHSLFFAPLAAPLVAYAAWRWANKQGAYWTWVHLCFWAIITHPMLDMFTTYGTQLFFPFSYMRVAFDGVSIIDPIYTLPLMFALAFSFVYRGRPEVGQRVTAAMLVFTTCYLLFGTFVSTQTEKKAHKQLVQSGFEPIEVRATPTLFNSILWRVLARNKQGDIGVGMYSSWAPKKIDFTLLKRPKDPLVEKTLAHDKGKLMMWFAGNMISFHIEKRPDETVVDLKDQRFGLFLAPAKTLMGARARFTKSGDLISINRFRKPPQTGSIGKEFGAMWGMMWTGQRPTLITPSKR